MKTEKVLKLFGEAVETKGFKTITEGQIENDFYRLTCIDLFFNGDAFVRCEQKRENAITNTGFVDLPFIKTLRFLKMRLGL